MTVNWETGVAGSVEEGTRGRVARRTAVVAGDGPLRFGRGPNWPGVKTGGC